MVDRYVVGVKGLNGEFRGFISGSSIDRVYSKLECLHVDCYDYVIVNKTSRILSLDLEDLI